MSQTEELFTCPCCGHLIFTEPPGSYEICSVCGWEDDPVQLANPCTTGGANKESLWEAQRNFEYTTPEPDLKEIESHGVKKDPSWRKMTILEMEIFMQESEQGKRWVNKGINDLTNAYWNRNIVQARR